MYKTYQRHFSKPRQIFGRRRSLFGEFSGTQSTAKLKLCACCSPHNGNSELKISDQLKQNN